MENRGGKREGAGRPLATKTLLTQRINEEITKRVHEQIGPMIDAQIKTVLAEKSNTSAFKMLLEYSVGKPKETIELGNVENKQFQLNAKLNAVLTSSINKIYGHSDQKNSL
ncbi:MAG: hypothetical protein WCW03_01220 [Candidatus Paceibacterota bacterium]|jgi:hypothetical protein